MRRRGQHQEGGASLVEFALVVPLLTLLLFGIVQFGIAYDKQQSINSAAREGARLGALPTTTLEEIGTRSVETYDASAAPGDAPRILVYGGDAGGALTGIAVRCGTTSYKQITADPTDDDCVSGGVVDHTSTDVAPCGSGNTMDFAFLQVEASTPYDITIPFFGVQTVDIDAEAQFRCE